MNEKKNQDIASLGDDWESAWRESSASTPDTLRQRVLDAVSVELQASQQANPRLQSTRTPAQHWPKLTVAAVLSLLWLHAAWSAALDSPRMGRHEDSTDFAAQVDQLRDLAPELSPTEARRVVLIQNAGSLVPAWRSPWRN
ncbi:MAG: hypothetical protein U1A77_13030 [Pirellulales bacterium]